MNTPRSQSRNSTRRDGGRFLKSARRTESRTSSSRALPDARVPYTFCEEFICACRTDTPRRLLDEWGDKNRKPCPAGKSFGVIGPNGLYRTCLHTLPRSRLMQ